jgi:hypothetical protein
MRTLIRWEDEQRRFRQPHGRPFSELWQQPVDKSFDMLSSRYAKLISDHQALHNSFSICSCRNLLV